MMKVLHMIIHHGYPQEVLADGRPAELRDHLDGTKLDEILHLSL